MCGRFRDCKQLIAIGKSFDPSGLVLFLLRRIEKNPDQVMIPKQECSRPNLSRPQPMRATA